MRRFLRGCAFLALGGVTILGVGYVTRGVVGHAHVAAAKKRAADGLGAALPARERRAGTDRDRVRASLDRLGAPAYSWQELVCELDTNDVGWIVEDWVQECHIRSVDLIPVAEASPGECESLYLPEAAEAARPATVSIRRGTSTLLASERYARMCPDGITGPPLGGRSRMLEGRRPESLSSSPAWVVVETDTPVSRTVLGCDPWALPFCSEPVDAPVMNR